MPGIDVHQHLWPPALVDALRRRTCPPRLLGWTLELAGEPAYRVDPAAHDVPPRAALDADLDLVLLSLSSPLGIEELPPVEAQPLLGAWHDGVRALPSPFRGWASVTTREPDLAGLKDLLGEGFAGLQLPATALLTPAAVESAAELLRVCELADRPVLVHPGPVAPRPAGRALPEWWPAVVDYPAQLQAAWWAWHAAGRSLLPQLRICFAAGAGLAPAQHERFTTRGGGRLALDPGTFVDISSYGRSGVDALVRVLGIDPLVLGSDRPYAVPADPQLGPAAAHALRLTNPNRLLQGGRP